MHHSFARRALLTQTVIVGAGSLLSACAGSSISTANKRPAAASSAAPSLVAASPQVDSASGSQVRGPVVLPAQYYETANGPFEAGTLEHGPRNVAKPKEPENMRELSEQGILSFLQYWCAAQNYMYLTGDISLFEALPGNDKYSTNIGIYSKLYSRDEGWVVCDTERPTGITLNTDRPVRIGSSEVFRWESMYTVDSKAHLYLLKAQRNVSFTDMYGTTRRADVFVKYGDTGWQMMDDAEVSAAKESLAPSASAASPSSR